MKSSNGHLNLYRYFENSCSIELIIPFTYLYIYQDFSFYYCQMSQTKDCILQIEQELIKGLNPRCNNGFDRNKITSERLTVARVEEELEKLIMCNK